MDSNKRNKLILRLFLALLVVLAGVLGYTTIRLNTQSNRLAAGLAAEQQLAEALKRKYIEEKAQGALLQRAKRDLEVRLAKSDLDLKAAREEKETFQKELAGLETKYAQKTVDLEARLKEYETRVQQMVETQTQTRSKLEEALKTAGERKAANEELAAKLQETDSGLKRCEVHNTKLSEIAEELLVAYQKKGMGASLAQAEPFTKLKKVELEQMIQKYLNRVDQENMSLTKPAQ